MPSHENRKITRRMFVKVVAGAAVYCACCSLDRIAASKEFSVQGGESKVHLAATCGTYCGACPAYLNKHGEGETHYPSKPVNASIDSFVAMMEGLQCDGYLSGGTLAAHCQSCSKGVSAASLESAPGMNRIPRIIFKLVSNLLKAVSV